MRPSYDPAMSTKILVTGADTGFSTGAGPYETFGPDNILERHGLARR